MEKFSMELALIAQLAGAEIIKIQESFSVEDFKIKGDGSPVTMADLRAQEIIQSALSKVSPEIPLVSEEGNSGTPGTSGFCFLVDPLDGTKEFIRGNGMYTVNIALMQRKENLRWKPVLGVVHAPRFGITWIGGDDVQPTKQNQVSIEKISVRGSGEIPIILGSVSHSSPKDQAFAQAIGKHVFEGVGSSMKICRVADGTADLAPRFGTTSCWDTAAAHAVLNAAGGNLVGPDGEELDYDITEEVLNPWFLATSGGKWVDLWIDYQD